ncbi:hypothetical protein Sste5344_008693 [Sporothrix stenoceras]
MRANWLSGRLWMTYAARKTWAFDAIYWRFLDEDLCGKRKDTDNDGYVFLVERLAMLPPAQVAAMDAFVSRKVSERDEA